MIEASTTRLFFQQARSTAVRTDRWCRMEIPPCQSIWHGGGSPNRRTIAQLTDAASLLCSEEGLVTPNPDGVGCCSIRHQCPHIACPEGQKLSGSPAVTTSQAAGIGRGVGSPEAMATVGGMGRPVTSKVTVPRMPGDCAFPLVAVSGRRGSGRTTRVARHPARAHRSCLEDDGARAGVVEEPAGAGPPCGGVVGHAGAASPE